MGHILGWFCHVLRWFLLYLARLVHHHWLILGHLRRILVGLLRTHLSSLVSVSKQLAVLAMFAHKVTGVSIPPDEDWVHHSHTDLAAAFSEALLDILLVELRHHVVAFIRVWLTR